jgi:G2/mitotic-specific cyclin 3/4
MASQAPLGLRGPAKRAAFGDVTNLAKNVGSGSNGVKMAKPYTGTFSQPTSANVNKENWSFVAKGNVDQPAQKPELQPSRANSAPETRPLDTLKRPATSSSHDFPSLRGQTIDEEPLPEAEHADFKQADLPPPVPTHSTRLQPRHHKSQPDLKARQQVLRRTQSRVIERPETVEEGSEEEVSVLDDLELPRPCTEEVGPPEVVELASMDTIAADVEIGEAIAADFEKQVPDDDSDAGLLDQILDRHQASLPARSEPDECWAEEEDDYYDDELAALDMLDETTGIPPVLQPKVTSRVQLELEEAKLDVQRTRTFDDIEEETWDVSMVAEYGDEIFAYMRELEVSTLVQPAPDVY